jgi:transposase
MKNKYMNRSHISERQFRDIIRLFALDLDAAHIAKFTKISRNTINSILSRIRDRIVALAEKEADMFKTGEIEIDESYFGARRARGKRGRGAYGKTKVFGMIKRGNNVYTQVVKNCSAAELVPIIKRLAHNDCTIYSDEWKAYDGLVNVGYKQHYRVKHSDDDFANGRAHVNGIENFWGVAKTRLTRFRGIRSDRFYKHLKETEFRFNHRQDNLYLLLLSELRHIPI